MNPSQTTLNIDLTSIVVDADFNARKGPRDVTDLMSSMGLVGQQNPVGVKLIENSDPPRYFLMHGFGRRLAAERLGWKQIRATIFQPKSKLDEYLINLSENVQTPLHFLDMALRLKEIRDQLHVKSDAIAHKVGITRERARKLLVIADKLRSDMFDKARHSPYDLKVSEVYEVALHPPYEQDKAWMHIIAHHDTDMEAMLKEIGPDYHMGGGHVVPKRKHLSVRVKAERAVHVMRLLNTGFCFRGHDRDDYVKQAQAVKLVIDFIVGRANQSPIVSGVTPIGGSDDKRS